MLGWILGAMALDLANSHKKKRQERSDLQEMIDLRHRLNRPLTKGHYTKCKCMRCQNKRVEIESKIKILERK